MKTLLTILSFIAFVQFCSADEQAIATAKSHLSSNLKSDVEELNKSYSPKIMLMPGHEFLKEEYGLAEPGGRATGLEVERGNLLAAMKKAANGRPERRADRIEKLLATLRYQVIEAEAGDFITAPSDPVGTPDGKLHFAIKAGDVLIKVSPPKGDFILLHLRKHDGAWKIVSEYLD